MLKNYSALIGRVYKFLYIQLFVTLISLPILIAWGIPLSLASWVGNMVFAPFLSALLLCASLMFFLPFFGIPCAWIGFLLDWITKSWIAVLSYGSHSFLVGFTKPSLLMLLLIIAITLALVHHRRVKSIQQGGVVLFIWLVMVICFLKVEKCPGHHFSVNYKHKALQAARHNGHTTIVVPPLSWYPSESLPQWIEYTLIPELYKNTGVSTIDCLIIVQDKKDNAHLLVEQLRKYLCVDTVLVIDQPRQVIKADESLCKGFYCKQFLLQNDYVEIKKRSDCSAFDILLTIDNKTSTLYSAKLRLSRKNKQKRSTHEPQKSFTDHSA